MSKKLKKISEIDQLNLDYYEKSVELANNMVLQRKTTETIEDLKVILWDLNLKFQALQKIDR